MLLPILYLEQSQFLIMDYEQIHSIVLLAAFMRLKDPVITVSPSMTRTSPDRPEVKNASLHF